MGGTATVVRLWQRPGYILDPRPVTSACPIDRARTAWLAGDSAAWSQYTACVLALPVPPHLAAPAPPRLGPARERSARRVRRRGRVARA